MTKMSTDICSQLVCQFSVMWVIW